MSGPVEYKFPDAYQNDGLASFSITLTYDSQEPVDITNSRVKMELRSFDGVKAFEFSTDPDTADALLQVFPGGVVAFPQINSWQIPAGIYRYDLQITSANGLVRTYMKGTWRVIGDITKKA